MYDENEYKYFAKEGKVYRLHVELDDMPCNPREEYDGNIGTMFCSHRRYTLGDETDYSDVEGMKHAILSELKISMARIRRYVKSGKTNLDLKFNRSSREWEIGGTYSTGTREKKYGLIDSSHEVEQLDDTLIDWVSVKDIEAVSGGELVVLPLYLYDHSGLTMNTTGFYCPWDSGQVGYIWTTMKRIKEGRPEKRTKKEWRDLALTILRGEVEVYDQYLRGDCYGYIEEKLRPDGEWEELISCWGYYSAKDPLTEIAAELYGDAALNELPETA